MDEPKIYRAICGSPETPLRINDIEIQCYVLEGGIRVLTGSGIQRALAMGERHGTLLRVFSGKNSPISNFSSKLSKLQNPYKFIRPGCGGKLAHGYDATLLADLCELVLQARDSGILPTKWLAIADQCDKLMRGFAKTGIIALVDEATGYQKQREKDELEKFLALYLTEERLKWAKFFPDIFYKEIYRLNKWDWPPRSTSRRPGVIGQYTNDIVYERLPKGVIEKLRELNPSSPLNGRRRYKHHQFFTEDIGQPDLHQHLLQLITLMKVSRSWKSFIKLVDRAFPRGNATQLDLLDE